jgi:hypothetical protein
MAQWYKGNRKLYLQERAALASYFPLLRLLVAETGFCLNKKSVIKDEAAVVHGTFGISAPNSTRQIEYGISIIIPERYPKYFPFLFCNDQKLPIGNIDRHIMEDGSACLGVYGEMYMLWEDDPNIVSFLNNFVAPFLVWQVYYDAYQKPAPWGQRAHFSEGIIEFYGELIGNQDRYQIISFMKLLARENCPKGHEICPCGSGERLRNCHKKLLYDIRERISWKYVFHDLAIIFREDKDKSNIRIHSVKNSPSA